MTPATAPATPAELLARVQEAWWPFRIAVAAAGSEALARATPSGRQDPITTTDDEIDRFNARAVVTRRLVGPEAMLDELDTAYRQLVAAVRGLRDEEIAGSSHGSGALSIVAWCSYLHFDEHLAELGAAVP